MRETLGIGNDSIDGNRPAGGGKPRAPGGKSILKKSSVMMKASIDKSTVK